MKDLFTKKWIIDNAINICNQYGYGILTLRALHYQLVSIGMINDIQHYKRTINAMIDARWGGQIAFEQFSDLDREMVGEIQIEDAKEQIKNWMNSYRKNLWENQIYYPEIFIEKKALQGIFQNICNKWNIALGACKGYPSLTFLNNAQKRFGDAVSLGKIPIIIYFGDYDPSGEDIPRSIKENIEKFGIYDINVKRIALMENQVIEWKLPHAPTKNTDTRTANWAGLGQVELDAVKPEKLIELCENAILEIFDKSAYNKLISQEKNERKIYQVALKDFVKEI